jgi:hypothetical protein
MGFFEQANCGFEQYSTHRIGWRNSDRRNWPLDSLLAGIRTAPHGSFQGSGMKMSHTLRNVV